MLKKIPILKKTVLILFLLFSFSSYSQTISLGIEHEEIIKKDDTVVGILTGRQKDAMIPVDYHHNSENTFANPPKN